MWVLRRHGRRPCSQTVDLPAEYGSSTARFRAALGHKVNFSFGPNAAIVEAVDTARFGIVGAVRSLDGPVKEGEELTADYQYPADHGLPWFQEQVRQLKTQKRHKGP